MKCKDRVITRLNGAQRTALAVLVPLVGAASVLVAASAPGSAAASLTDMRVSQEAGAVQSWAARHGGTGVFWDAAAGTLVTRVPRARMGGARDALAAFMRTRPAQLAGLPVAIRPAAAPASEINAGLAILARRGWVPSAKKYTWAFFYSPQRDVTVVETDAPATVTGPLLRLLRSPVDLQHGTAHRDSRNNDKAPFTGGAGLAITNAAGKREQCSAGFAIHTELGATLLLTAGHCAEPGAEVKVLGASAPGTTVVGKVLDRVKFPENDSEVINITSASGSPSASGKVWGRGAARLAVKGQVNPVVNEGGWFTSGSATGLQGGRRIVSTSATVCFNDGGCTTDLMSFRGGKLGQSGDSGAPVFKMTGGGVLVGGTYVGADGGLMFAEKWSKLRTIYGGDPEVITS